MELWFIYALLSMLFAGIFTFGLKVIAEKNLNGNLLTAIHMGISSFFSLLIYLFTNVQLFNISDGLIPITLAATAGIMLSSLYIIQIKALKHIDAILFYPLYKVLGPVVVLIIGMFFLKESLSLVEFIAVGISLITPLLLISRSEDRRQKNLKKGLIGLLITAVLSGIVAIFVKIAIDANLSIWLILCVQNLFGLIMNFLIGWRTKNYIKIEKITKEYLKYGLVLGCLSLGMSAFFFLSLKHGLVSIVYAFQSIYILIPIVLSIWFYKEHINTRKIVAIILSIIAIALFQI